MDLSHRRFQAALLGVTLVALTAAADAPKPASPSPDKGVKPLKVFILAGQSNMQGHVNLSTFDSMADDPKTAPLLEEMRGPDGKPRVCEKVWISSVGCAGDGWSDVIEQKGKLTAGFGASTEEIGPEFTFGIYMEKLLDEPILVIKTSWGRRNLHTDFRPPSAGPYVWSDYELAQCKRRGDDLEKDKADKVKATGMFYRHMIEHVRKVLADIKRVAPEYDEKQGYELAGFVWFQGFNDLVSDWTYDKQMKPGGYDLYGELLAHFIRDVRKDLSAPKMPFVIGVMGIGGVQEGKKPPQLYFRQAQAGPASLPEFKGNVVTVQTEACWDDELDALQQRSEKLNAKLDQEAKKDPNLTPAAKDEARKKAIAENFTPEELKRMKGISNGGYHYLGAAKIMAPIGKAFAEAMPPAELKPAQPTREGSLKPVKVFILAGQSNMEGQGFIKADPQRNGGKGSLEFLVKDSATADKFKHLVGKDGHYAVAQLSPWVLWPPDGLNLKQGTSGELFGYGYLPLPLTTPKKATAGKDVPAETGLAKVEFHRQRNAAPEPYVTPDEADSCWKKPGPAAGPFEAKLGDGSVVTYYWHRFADQPALLNADLTADERENLQKRVEMLHKKWTKDREYLPPPTVGKLADLDPAVIVTPPKGLEIGYVPIVTRQGAQRGD